MLAGLMTAQAWKACGIIPIRPVDGFGNEACKALSERFRIAASKVHEQELVSKRQMENE